MTGMPKLSPDIYSKRRAKFMQLIGDDGVAIIPSSSEVTRSRDTHFPFRQDSDFRYLTGFNEPDSVAVIAPGLKGGSFIMFVRARDATQEIWHGRRAGPDGVKARFGADQAFNIEEFEDMLPELLSGRERVHYTLAEHSSLDGVVTECMRQIREVSRRGAVAPTDILAMEGSLHEMRLIKDAQELELMHHAGRVSAAAHIRAMEFTQPGLHEWQVMAEMHHEFAAHEMQPGYGSIVAGGENACILHYTENDALLHSGDLLLIDAGGEFRGYTADITRTFPVNGKFTGEQKAVYEVVLQAQLAAIDTLRAGKSAGSPHEVSTRVLTEGMVELGLLSGDVDELIANDAQKQFFMHGTGHWLGLDVHDVGRYKQNGRFRKFEPGMVMTVEPGIYISPGTEGVSERFWGIGIRIEDDVAVTNGEPLILTDDVPKTVEAIEALMAG